MKNFYLVLIFVLSGFWVQAQTLNGIDPNSGFAGQQNLSTTITGTNLFQVISSPWGNIYDINLRQGSNVITIFDQAAGTMPSSVDILNADSTTAIFSIPSSAALGLYDLELTTTDPFAPGTNLVPYSVTGAFTVVAPDGYISGKVYYDTNGNGIFDASDSGLVGQPITLQPGNQIILSDANGDYAFGVSNGTYNVLIGYNYSHAYVLSSDSSGFTASVNSANVSNLDFGVVEGLTSLNPAIGYQGIQLNANITSLGLFASGANPWGNISYSYIRKNTAPTNQTIIPASSYTVLDSVNAQLLFTFQGSQPLGTYDLVVLIGNYYYYLNNALTIEPPPSVLSGNCYFDSNNNGSYDPGEPPINSVRLSLSPENSFAYSNSNGDFAFGANLGSHVLSYIAQIPSNWALTTQPSYTFSNSGNQSGFDFGFRSTLPDYTSSITFSHAFMRCNAVVTSTLNYTNMSNVVCQGQVYVIHSPNTTFSSSVPAASSQSGDTVFWSFTGLQPMVGQVIQCNFINPPNGIVQFNAGIIVTDGLGAVQFYTSIDDSIAVRCSYDPNDKEAYPEGMDDVMHYTLNSESLEYQIRFQNTGNDTAFTVYIRDTIDASFDINTLEVLASSHPVQTQVDSNRAMVFTFNNILLADSVIDEPHSHGFVRYRIHPLANLPDPTRVENTAYIYFDVNPAVVTNTSWNTLVQMLPVGIVESIQVNDGVFFYPNPMDSKGYFTFSNSKTEHITMELFDIKGQRVSLLETTGTMIELNREGLSSGLYLFRLINMDSGIVKNGKITLR